VIELAASLDGESHTIAQRIAIEACAREGRTFAGVRNYLRGAAFLRKAANAGHG
jgi:hypothetical protein